MKKALMVTVGVGPGVESAISKSVKLHNPDFVLFLASKESLETLEREVEGRRLAEGVPNEVVRVDDTEDFQHVYEKAKEGLGVLASKGYSPAEISVDYTAGTKVMSSALLMLASVHDLASATYVGGGRDARGTVVSGGERLTTIEPNRLRADFKMNVEFPALFNSYQFKACMRVIDELERSAFLPRSDLEKVGELRRLVEGHEAWDLFDHKLAHEKMEEVKTLNVKGQVDFLSELLEEKIMVARKYPTLKGQVPTRLLIADLISNAERRMEQGAYDDAVARLYRTLEALAQHALLGELGVSNRFNIKEVEGKVSDEILEKQVKPFVREGDVVELGLEHSFELIRELDREHPLSVVYSSNENKVKELMSARNNSILAHGFSPIKEEVCGRLKELTLQLAEAVLKDSDAEDFDAVVQRAKFYAFEGGNLVKYVRPSRERDTDAR